MYARLFDSPSICLLPRQPARTPAPPGVCISGVIYGTPNVGVRVEKNLNLRLLTLTSDTTKPHFFLSFLYVLYILYIVYIGYNVACWLHTIELDGLSTTLWMTERWAWPAHAPQKYCFTGFVPFIIV